MVQRIPVYLSFRFPKVNLYMLTFYMCIIIPVFLYVHIFSLNHLRVHYGHDASLSTDTVMCMP